MVGMLACQSMVGSNQHRKCQSNNKVRMVYTIDLPYPVGQKQMYHMRENFGQGKMGKFGKQNIPFDNFYLPSTSFCNQLQQYIQLIHQYFTHQLVCLTPFVNILPLQNFPMHSIYNQITLYGLKVFVFKSQIPLHPIAFLKAAWNYLIPLYQLWDIITGGYAQLLSNKIVTQLLSIKNF